SASATDVDARPAEAVQRRGAVEPRGHCPESPGFPLRTNHPGAQRAGLCRHHAGHLQFGRNAGAVKPLGLTLWRRLRRNIPLMVTVALHALAILVAGAWVVSETI